MNILGIETSCDETSAAIVEDGVHLKSLIVSSQDEVHAPHGGIVPELASRAHIEKIHSIVSDTLEHAHLTLEDIDGVVATSRPGLIGSLLVGLSYAKGLAYAQNLPFCGIDHLEAHLHAVFLEHPVEYPFVGLLVSGGHTALYDVCGVGQYTLLGATHDDAAGEAFDKVGKLLGMGYPAGKKIDECAKTGTPSAISFPRGYKSTDLNFSFSGLKTAVLRSQKTAHEGLREQSSEYGTLTDICASFQEAVVDTLLHQSLKALEQTKHNRLVVAGGVAANSRLRELFKQQCEVKEIRLYIPSFKLCTDNAAMVAALGYHYLVSGKRDSWSLTPTASQLLV